MNSMSKGHNQDEKDCDCKREKKEAGVLLKCKTSNSETVTVTDEEKIKKIATLSLNTGHFSDPCTKFDFSTNLILSGFGANADNLTVNFQLFKLCRGEKDPTTVGGEWIFTKHGLGGNFPGSRDIITFIVCDCDCDCDCDKDDCCTYFVKASIILDRNGEGTPPPSNGTVTFNNPTLSALVVEKASRC